MWLPSEKKSATGLVIFLLFKKGTNLSGYPKQKIFVFKVREILWLLLPENFKWL